MPDCDLCGDDHEDLETLQFGRDHGEPWRVARVCDGCREGRVMPVLRHLFGGDGLNVAEPDGDGWERIDPGDRNALFFVFEGTEVVHIAKRVERPVALPSAMRCVGYCGIEHRTEPEPRQRPLSARREGIVVCGRCARHAPAAYMAAAGAAPADSRRTKQ